METAGGGQEVSDLANFNFLILVGQLVAICLDMWSLITYIVAYQTYREENLPLNEANNYILYIINYLNFAFSCSVSKNYSWFS